MSDLRTAAEELAKHVIAIQKRVDNIPYAAGLADEVLATLAQPEPPVSVPSVEELQELLCDAFPDFTDIYYLDKARELLAMFHHAEAPQESAEATIADLQRQLAEQTGKLQQAKAENATLEAWKAANREKVEAMDVMERLGFQAVHQGGHESNRRWYAWGNNDETLHEEERFDTPWSAILAAAKASKPEAAVTTLEEWRQRVPLKSGFCPWGCVVNYRVQFYFDDGSKCGRVQDWDAVQASAYSHILPGKPEVVAKCEADQAAKAEPASVPTAKARDIWASGRHYYAFVELCDVVDAMIEKP